MSGEDKQEVFNTKEASFGKALSCVNGMKEFRKDVLIPLQEQEKEIPRPEWRQKFRRELPFWKLLSSEQKRHVRNIFAHMLPDPDVDTSSFDSEERLMLDIVAEEYIRQALSFADTVEGEQYRPKEEVERDYPGRVLVLTLSASLFFFDVPDQYGKRGYSYQNIYGNNSIPSSGRCRLKGGFKCGESLMALEFHTSAVQLVADTEAMASRFREFEYESKLFHRSFSDTFHGISVKSRKSFSGFVHELTFSSHTNGGSASESGEDEGGEGEDGGKSGDSVMPDNVARLPVSRARVDFVEPGGDSSDKSSRSGTAKTPKDDDES